MIKLLTPLFRDTIPAQRENLSATLFAPSFRASVLRVVPCHGGSPAVRDYRRMQTIKERQKSKRLSVVVTVRGFAAMFRQA